VIQEQEQQIAVLLEALEDAQSAMRQPAIY
jgi:hypothetical protein